MFERFTDDARKATIMAQEVSRQMHHPFIATEHQILGLLSIGDATAQVLSRYGDEESLRQRVEVVLSDHREQFEPTGHVPFTVAAKSAMERSLRMALEWDHRHIATHEFAAALVRWPEYRIEWVPDEERDALIEELRDLPVSVEVETKPKDRAAVCPRCGLIMDKERLAEHIDDAHPSNIDEVRRLLDRIGILHATVAADNGETQTLTLNTQVMVFDMAGNLLRPESAA